jgi:hypothetical protein
MVDGIPIFCQGGIYEKARIRLIPHLHDGNQRPFSDFPSPRIFNQRRERSMKRLVGHELTGGDISSSRKLVEFGVENTEGELATGTKVCRCISDDILRQHMLFRKGYTLGERPRKRKRVLDTSRGPNQINMTARISNIPTPRHHLR